MIDMTPIAQAVIALLSAIITAVLIPYILAKTTAVQQAKLQTWINVAVLAAAQIYKGSDRGTEKKNYVLEFLNKQGLTYDAAAIDALIEAAVKSLNIQQEAAAVVAVTASPVAVAEAGETVVVKLPSVDTDLISGKYII